MPETSQTRVLIVVFDALRPDMVSAQTMPNLSAFAERSVSYTNSRCVFPSETRVNQSALVTGCYPGRHGIVANQFVELTASPQALFNTGNEDALRTGDQRLDGALLLVPSLGEYLAGHGLSLATISSGTPGGGRILNHRAEQSGGFRLAMHRPDATTPANAQRAIEDRIGPIPPAAIPSLQWLRWSTDAWLQYVEPQITPDVGIVWYCEPDSSYHYCGIGSPDNLAALREVDRQFGRLVQAYKNEIDRGQLQIITLSDHGQLAVQGEPVDIAAALTRAGLKVGAVPVGDIDIAVSVDSAGGLFCRDRDPEIIVRALHCLDAQPWCGALVDLGGSYGLTLADLGLDGPRAPDIALVLKANGGNGPHGWPGSTRHDAGYPQGGGIHGGLHRLEMNNWLAMAGTAFGPAQSLQVPAGIVDVLPTVLHLLNVPGGDQIQGRPLTEALSASARPAGPVGHTTVGSGRTALQVSQVGDTRYLNGLLSTGD